jgi:hypothetical protein
MKEVGLMNRNDVPGRMHREESLANRLRNARLRLHMSRRLQREELPLLEDQALPTSRERNEQDEPTG